jgi:hypothetical protein
VSASEDTRWNDEQDQIIRETMTKPRSEVVTLVNLFGPRRGLAGVEKRRRVLRALDANLRRTSRQVVKIERDWPALEGTHEERDRRFQRVLWRAQLDALQAARGAA